MELIAQFRQSTQKTVSSLKEDLKSIRTGRATPALVENVEVTTYGGTAKLKLKEVATITTEGPQTLVIAPFDQSTIGDIERGILASSVGLTPSTQGIRILVKIPPLSQEQREKFIKLSNQKVEEHKVSVRGQRDEVRRKIRAQFDNKTITEDAKFRLEKEVDQETTKVTEELDAIRTSKEREIKEI